MAHKTERLEGKTALITGGSRGIGKAIAERFCEEGAAVIITGRSSGNGAQTAGQLRRTGYDVHFEEVEVTNTRSIETMVGRAAAQLNGIDILVNNAGILDVRSIRKLNLETWDTVIATNLTGPVFCMRSVAAYMAERGEGGSIINMASIAGIDCGPGLASYAASKAGVIAATQVAAKEFARDHIRVNAVAPGVIDTDMTSVMSDRARQASTDNTPLGRMGVPEDIAGATVFLASEEAAFVTGQTLRIDGGLSL